ncbi:hypothetical protein Tco_0322336, partial [Tanacetum coccineum]
MQGWTVVTFMNLHSGLMKNLSLKVTHQELMDIVPKLVLRIDHLEKELHQTKSTYGKAVLTLVERVKFLEAALKRKSRKVILEAQEEDTSPTTLEAAKTLSKVASQNVSTYKRIARSASKGEYIGIGVNTSNTPVSTLSVIQTVNVIVPSPIRQEESSLAEAMRLQALQDEENARQVHLDALLAKRIQEEQELSEQQQKRKAEVQEAAQ